MVGSGFRCSSLPRRLELRVSNWPTAVFNAMDAFKGDFRCITMDQRNANGGESTGPIPASDPWAPSRTTSWADGPPRRAEVLLHGYCIGGSFGLKLIERAPSASWPPRCASRLGIGRRIPTSCTTPGAMSGPRAASRRPKITVASIEAYLHNLYRLRPDFVYSVSREFVRSCQTPLLVMPDDTPAHPIRRPWTLPRSRRRCSRRYFLGESRRLAREDDRPGACVPTGAPAGDATPVRPRSSR